MNDPLDDLLLNLGNLDDLFESTEADTNPRRGGAAGVQMPQQQQVDTSFVMPAQLWVQPAPGFGHDPCSGLQAQRKRGRPKGKAVNQSCSKELQEQLDAKLAELDLLRKENELLSHTYTILDMVVQARDEEALRLQILQTGKADSAMSIIGMDTQAFLQRSLRDMAQSLRELMMRVGSTMLQAELSGDYRQLTTLLNRVEEATKYAMLLRPDGLLLSGRDITESSKSIENANLAPLSHWRSVVAQMQISPEVCHQIWVLYELYLKWHAKLLRDRGITNSALSRVLHVRRYGQVSTGDCVTQGIEDQVLLDRLHASLTSERCLMILVTGVMRNRLLKPVQVARMIVHSYPFCMDGIAIVAAAAALYGPPLSHCAGPPTAPPPYSLKRSTSEPQFEAYTDIGCTRTAAASICTRTQPPSSSIHAASLLTTPQPPVLPPSPLLHLAKLSSRPTAAPSLSCQSAPLLTQPHGKTPTQVPVPDLITRLTVPSQTGINGIEYIPGSIVLNHALSSGGSSKLPLMQSRSDNSMSQGSASSCRPPSVS